MSFEVGTKVEFFYQEYHNGVIEKIIPLKNGTTKYVVGSIKNEAGAEFHNLALYVQPDETPETSADFNEFRVTDVV